VKDGIAFQILALLVAGLAFGLLGIGAIFDDKRTFLALPDMSAKVLGL
jgi:hypothetical protein